MNRIDLLKRLIDQHDAGQQAAFAKRVGVSPSQLNQWLSGHRRLGDAGARRIELALRLAPGHFGAADHVPMLRAEERQPDVVTDILRLVESMTPEGRYVALGKLEEIAARFPATKAKSGG